MIINDKFFSYEEIALLKHNKEMTQEAFELLEKKIVELDAVQMHLEYLNEFPQYAKREVDDILQAIEQDEELKNLDVSDELEQKMQEMIRKVEQQ